MSRFELIKSRVYRSLLLPYNRYCLPIINQLNYMDRFLKWPALGDKSQSHTKKPKSDAKQGNISAAFRVQEFKAYFYDSVGKMFCKSCNVVVDHTRKFVVKQHLDSKKHKGLAIDLGETLLKANIPVGKLNHPAFRDFVERRIPGGGAIPKASSFRQWLLPTIQKAHDSDLQAIMDEVDGVVVIVDETSDNLSW